MSSKPTEADARRFVEEDAVPAALGVLVQTNRHDGPEWIGTEFVFTDLACQGYVVGVCVPDEEDYGYSAARWVANDETGDSHQTIW